MRLKQYIELLNKVFKKHWNLELISSSDDEWNSFHPVIFWPEAMYVKKVEHYIDEICAEEDKIDGIEYTKVICIN